jgi:hypothetical protein
MRSHYSMWVPKAHRWAGRSSGPRLAGTAALAAARVPRGHVTDSPNGPAGAPDGECESRPPLFMEVQEGGAAAEVAPPPHPGEHRCRLAPAGQSWSQRCVRSSLESGCWGCCMLQRTRGGVGGCNAACSGSVHKAAWCVAALSAHLSAWHDRWNHAVCHRCGGCVSSASSLHSCMMHGLPAGTAC